MSLSTRRVERPQLALALVAAVVALVAAVAPGHADAHATVVYDDAGEIAPDIGLIGDSSLAGVRWYEAYGDLREYNYVLNAESCRRTVETSCWSREGYRPDNAVTTLQELSGQWGDLLVVMSGYNDTHYLFDDAVDAVVEEARRQGIPKVMWLTLRTADVNYEEPLHQANGSTYNESNRMLFDQAEEHGDYLQIADWATYSADRPEWVTDDGVHLTGEGASELTSFIADQAGAVLDGETITPAQRPWVTLSVGETGDAVADVQRALIDEDISSVGGADGEYGDVTAAAVQEFQREHGLDETGVVDIPTAVALGVYEAPELGDTSDTGDADGARSAGSARNAATADRQVEVPDAGTDDASADGELTDSPASMEPGSGSGSSLNRETLVAGALIAIAAATAIAIGVRRRALRRQQGSLRTFDPAPASISPADETQELDRPDDLSSLVMIETVIDPPYDHEREAAPADTATSS